mgnify:CR=1 FL=1|jgi:hypothetical protein
MNLPAKTVTINLKNFANKVRNRFLVPNAVQKRLSVFFPLLDLQFPVILVQLVLLVVAVVVVDTVLLVTSTLKLDNYRLLSVFFTILLKNGKELINVKKSCYPKEITGLFLLCNYCFGAYYLVLLLDILENN